MIKYKELEPHKKKSLFGDFILIALKKLAVAVWIGVGIYLIILFITFLIANPQYFYLVPLIGIPGAVIVYIIQSAWEKAKQRFENRDYAWTHRCEDLRRCEKHEKEYHIYQDVLNSGLDKNSKEYKEAFDKYHYHMENMRYYQREVANWEKQYVQNGGKL